MLYYHNFANKTIEVHSGPGADREAKGLGGHH